MQALLPARVVRSESPIRKRPPTEAASCIPKLCWGAESLGLRDGWNGASSPTQSGPRPAWCCKFAARSYSLSWLVAWPERPYVQVARCVFRDPASPYGNVRPAAPGAAISDLLKSSQASARHHHRHLHRVSVTALTKWRGNFRQRPDIVDGIVHLTSLH
jgi:hypothetical protein